MFEGPATKGSFTSFDYPSLPLTYRGAWADRVENCFAASDRGRQTTLPANAIGLDRLVKVEGFSDHAEVLVRVRAEDGETARIFLDISLDLSTIPVACGGQWQLADDGSDF